MKYKLSCTAFACFEFSIFFLVDVLKSKWYLSSCLDNGAEELDYKAINQSKNLMISSTSAVKSEWLRLSLQKD